MIQTHMNCATYSNPSTSYLQHSYSESDHFLHTPTTAILQTRGQFYLYISCPRRFCLLSIAFHETEDLRFVPNIHYTNSRASLQA